MPQQRKKPELGPQVGIFWVVHGTPIVAGTPVSKVTERVGLRDYAGSHAEYWRTLQERRVVPAGSQYSEFPRGRVLLNTRTGAFSFYADKCILNDREMVIAIMKELHLPPSRTKIDTDLRYRCACCLGRHRAQGNS